jgi:hypothetical protein
VYAATEEGVRVWNAEHGTLRHRILLRTPYDLDMALNGRHVAVATPEGTEIVTFDLAELVALARSRLTRTFTPDECRQHLHVEACPADLPGPAPVRKDGSRSP